MRKFRHFFRNAYVLELDAVKLRSRADDLLRIHDVVAAGMRSFGDHLANTLADLSR